MTLKMGNALSSPIAAGSAAILGRILQLGTGTLTTLLLPLCLSQENVGFFFLLQSFIAAMATLGLLGLSITAPAFISQAIGQKDFGKVRQIISSVFFIGTISALLLSAILMLFIYLLKRMYSSQLIELFYELSPIIVLSIISAITITLLCEQHRAVGHYIQASFVAMGGSLATALLILFTWIVTRSLSLVMLLQAGLTGLVLFILFYGFSLWKKLKYYQSLPKTSISYKDILIQTRPNLVTSMVLLFVAQADLWTIALFGDYKGLAIYGLASRFALLIIIPLGVVNTVIAPSIGKIFVRNKERYLQKILGAGASCAMVLATLGYVFFLLLGKSVFAFLWPHDFINAYYIFVILGLSQLAQTYAGTAGFVLIMLQKQHIVMNISVSCGIIMAVVGVIAMKIYGILGLASVYAVGSVIQSLLTIHNVKIIFGLNTTPNFKFLMYFIKNNVNKRYQYG